VLAETGAGIDVLEAALDAERRAMMHANETRLQRYMAAAWAACWPAVEAEIAGLPLSRAHGVVAARVEGVLPFEPPEEPGDSAA
jgi:hypothetical protein